MNYLLLRNLSQNISETIEGEIQNVAVLRSSWFNKNMDRAKNSKREIMQEVDTKLTKMADLVKWNPVQNPKWKGLPSAEEEVNVKDTDSIDVKPASATLQAPQLILDNSGNLVLDEGSLVQKRNHNLLESTWKIPYSATSRLSNNSFAKPRDLAKVWREDETELFYKILQGVGLDFGLMANLLPRWSRTQLKLKYKREAKKNATRINQVLTHPILFGEDIVKIACEGMKDLCNADEAIKVAREWKRKRRNTYMPRIVADKMRTERDLQKLSQKSTSDNNELLQLIKEAEIVIREAEKQSAYEADKLNPQVTGNAKSFQEAVVDINKIGETPVCNDVIVAKSVEIESVKKTEDAKEIVPVIGEEITMFSRGIAGHDVFNVSNEIEIATSNGVAWF